MPHHTKPSHPPKRPPNLLATTDSSSQHASPETCHTSYGWPVTCSSSSPSGGRWWLSACLVLFRFHERFFWKLLPWNFHWQRLCLNRKLYRPLLNASVRCARRESWYLFFIQSEGPSLLSYSQGHLSSPNVKLLH